jgi:cytochrome c-type biogenesis protein CcmH/NrfG
MADNARGQAPNREQLLQMAISAAKQNNKNAARLMFRQILSEDKDNERAMMWMAKLAESKEERKVWLQRVLSVNPANDIARDTLDRLSYSRSARDNRVLLIFGVLAAVLIVLAIIIVVVVLTSAR